MNTERIIFQFNKAFVEHDSTLLDGLIAQDCVMESAEGPDGVLTVGYDECMKFWRAMANDRQTQFEPEEIHVMGDRGTIRWRYFWGENKSNNVRGVSLVRIDKGKIVEVVAYAKSTVMALPSR